MKQKLLFLFLLVSANVFSQTIANQPPNIFQCQSEVFNLTQQDAIILGNQDPTQFSVTYYLTEQNAHDQINPITNPTQFVGQEEQIIIARVDDDLTTDYALTAFMIGWGPGIFLPPMEDVVVCDVYVLPALEIGNYYSQPGGQGPVLNMGDVISTTQTVYIFAQDGNCFGEESFTVTVLSTPGFFEFPDVTACTFYVLPQLEIGGYFTAPNGGGAPIQPGTTITASQTIYVFASNGDCTAEDSFVLTVVPAPPLEPFDNIYTCTSYTLPFTSGDYTLQFSMNGVEIAPGTVISQTAGIQVVATFEGCIVQDSFEVIIGIPGINYPAPLESCDTGGGIVIFNLNPVLSGITAELTGYNTTVYTSLANAQAEVNPIANTSAYSSATATLYVRVDSDTEECSTILELQLVVGDCTEYTITGVVQLDNDGNGCDENDPPAPNVIVGAYNGNSVQFGYTNSEGEYTITNVAPGTNIIEIGGIPSGYINPGSQTVIFPGSGNDQVVNFCLELAPAVSDVAVNIYPQGNARPGLPVSYVVFISNIGNQTVNGSATYAFDGDRLTFNSATPAQSSIAGNVITFNFDNLLPGGFQSYVINFTVGIPPIAELGDILNFIATVNITATDATPDNNTATYNHTIVNSQDPNDIVVVEGPFITEEQAGKYLNYIIRFQNIGNADAINVRIENILSENLNWNTFVPVTSSHSYFAERQGSLVEFRFDNINLPGSAVDEPGSHGYIAYKIRPVVDFAVGEIITNNASIFFDFNAPIVTNTVTTQIQLLGVPENDLGTVKVYPNPASGMVNIESLQPLDGVMVYNIEGKTVLTSTTSGNAASIDVSALESGLYFLRISSEGETVTKKLMVR